MGRPKRGLIISSPTEIDLDRNAVKVAGGIDGQELRLAALYWDRLAWPASRGVYVAGGPDEDFLQKVGMLSRPDHTAYGSVAAVVADSYIAVLRELDEKEPGQWGVSLGEKTLKIVGGTLANVPGFSPANNLQVELIRAIPVPDKDVPLAEVLEFKRKRKDELERLREELDKIQDRVRNALHHEAELAKAKIEIDRACADAIKVASEWQWPFRLTNFRASYNGNPLSDLSEGASIISDLILDLSDTNVELGLLRAGSKVLSGFKISHDGYEYRGIRKRPGPYGYVAHFHRELFNSSG